MKITRFFVHHFGGVRNDPYVSTKHLTFEDINRAHFARWPNFPSELNGSFVGYTAIIFPDGSMEQSRFVGEETAAQKGYNTGSVAFCLAGNFTRRSGGAPVEKPTLEQEIKLKNVIMAFTEGKEAVKRQGLSVIEGLEIDISFSRFLPHRAVANTQCYGSHLSDQWLKDFVHYAFLEKQRSLLIKLRDTILALLAALKKQNLGGFPQSCFELEDVRG